MMILFGGLLVYQIPAVRSRIDWRLDFALIYLRGVLRPAQPLPTALPEVAFTSMPQPSSTPTITLTPFPTNLPSPTPTITPQPTFTPTPLPPRIVLTPSGYQKQDINNCGPATLALYLKYYGWKGDQFVIANEVKPFREDRNVNIDELVNYARKNVNWLKTEYRVNGSLALLRELLANGFPVMIEEGMVSDQSYWLNDDLWAAHYLLVTAYDDATQTFIVQDTFYGADRKVKYADLDREWHVFNRVYLLVYPPEKESQIKSILGKDWYIDLNRQNALQQAEEEVQAYPENAFAWFNYGTNLVYFQRYEEAARAYDRAREIGLPQRMLRYQFGPFIAYFRIGRYKDLEVIVKYALERTPNAEEALLWQGWLFYRQGKRQEAINSFQKALSNRPGYGDALYALDYLRKN